MAGILLLLLVCFGAFYFSARGGNQVLGTFVIMGLAVVTAVGSDSIDAVLAIKQGVGGECRPGHGFHLARTCSVAGQRPATRTREAEGRGAHRLIWRCAMPGRATVITFPIMVFFLLLPGSSAYIAVMIKTSSMAQQAEATQSKAAAKSLLLSTAIGGLAAVVMWNVLSIWPSVLIYSLLVVLGGLILGRRIFQGPAVHPQFATMSYAYLTMLVIIGPAVMDLQG